MAKSVSLLLGSAVFWAAPMTGAFACDSQPPKEAPSSHQVSSASSGGGQQNCFRRHDAACDQARKDYNHHHVDD
jgi:hypothetical protein